MSRIALFADVQNLYYTVRQAYACHFNYTAMWNELAAQGEIVEAYAYAIDRGDARQQQFQQILRNLGVTSVRLLTNNPDKANQLEQYGVKVAQRLPVVIAPTSDNLRYLQTKAARMGHDLPDLKLEEEN